MPSRPDTPDQRPSDQRPPEEDWSRLMAQSQTGDARAYRLLLTGITPYLRALAHRFGLSGSDIEDAVQDALLTLHSIRHTYDPGRPFAPWLVAVARHRMLDYRRKRVRQFGRETELTDFHETFAAAETNPPERAGEGAKLRAAIAELPAGQRQAVELLRLQEMSLKEASAKSGQSETALKVAMHRAVKRLRMLLGEE
jgi:RNA polymerase sigma-70 factor (ECF subfamily)